MKWVKHLASRPRWALFAVILVVAAITAAGLLAATGPTSDKTVPKRSVKQSRTHLRANAPAPSPAELAKIKSVALQIAGATGDKTPESGRVYPTSRVPANETGSFGATSDTDQPVYLIVLRGSFNAATLPLPGGTPVPTGTVETIVWDPARDIVTDFGVKDSIPNTASLGPGIDLGL